MATLSRLAEAPGKRRDGAVFVAKATDPSAEAAETQNWISNASACGYIDEARQYESLTEYGSILRTLHAMIAHSESGAPPSK